MTRWMAIRAPVAIGRHGWARRDDTPDGKSGSREPKSPRVGARGGAPKGPRKNRRVGSENQFAATIGRLRRRRQAPPSVSKTPVVTNNVDEPVDDAKRALVGALAAVALAAAPVADAMTDGMIGNVDVAQLFELAGFGAPTGALDSPPLPEQQLKQILDLDERAALRKASLIRTGNYDVLLQELNALTQLDEKALEAADAEAALAAAARLTSNIRDVEDSYVADVDASNARERQRVRLLDRRRLEAEFQTRLLQRKVDESRLGEQGNAIVYGAALAASFLSTAAMHPVDTVKVRRQTRESKGEGPSDDGTPDSSSDSSSSIDGDDYSFTTGNTSGTPSGAPAGSYYDGGGSGTALETAPAVHVAATATATMEELDISTITDQYAGVKGSQRDSSDTFQNSPEPPSKEDKIFEPLGVPLTPTGLLSLYDGLAPNLLKEGPPLALYLGIYEALKTALLATDALREEPVLCYLIAGAVGELIGSVVRVPAEAVKSTRQADGTVTMADAMETNFGSERARSNLVRAWSVAVVRDVPFGAVQIALFEALKVALSGQCDPIIDGDSFIGEAVLGAFGGGVGAFISAPADVVVTRLIKQQSAGGEDGENDMGPIDMVRAIYAEGGVGAFFNGAGERVLYWAPAIGIFLTAYCQVRHVLL